MWQQTKRKALSKPGVLSVLSVSSWDLGAEAQIHPHHPAHPRVQAETERGVFFCPPGLSLSLNLRFSSVAPLMGQTVLHRSEQPGTGPRPACVQTSHSEGRLCLLQHTFLPGLGVKGHTLALPWIFCKGWPVQGQGALERVFSTGAAPLLKAAWTCSVSWWQGPCSHHYGMC